MRFARGFPLLDPNRLRPGVFGRDKAVGKHHQTRDVEGRRRALGRIFDEFFVRRIAGGDAFSILDFDLDYLFYAYLLECSCIGFVEAFEFDRGEFGESELAGVVVAVQAVVVRFDFFEIAEKGALGSGFIAVGGGVEFVVFVGPVIEVGGEFPFDFFETLFIAFENPVGAGKVFD